MAKVLYDYNLPDMRRKRTSIQLAGEIFSLNQGKVMEGYNRAIGKSNVFGPVPSPIELLADEIDRQAKKNPKLTQKEIAIKALNSRMFSTREEVYARNTIDMLKRGGKYDELRRLTGWNKGIKTELFEYDNSVGYMIYAGEYVIYHAQDYYTDDGLQILSIEEFHEKIW